MSSDFLETPAQEASGTRTTDAEGVRPAISVIVPTFHRPAGALAAVRSVFAQADAPTFEVLLVDNDAGRSAADAARTLADEAPVPFTYAVEPAAGVANAHNTAVSLARGAFIAFLDDNEVAKPGWLSALVAAQAVTGADVVFGPIEARLPQGAEEPATYFQAFFSRTLPGKPLGPLEKPFGCGNSFLKVETTIVRPAPFDPDTNETGGEDDLLFQGVRERGGSFAWAPDAWVWEDVPAARASWRYLTRRAFAFGHNTTSLHFFAQKPNPAKGVLSMLRGAVQAGGMAPIFLALWLVRHERRAWAWDKMMRGLGKVFWFGSFRQAFYGEAAARRVRG